MKKIIAILTFSFLVTGCTTNDLQITHENMKELKNYTATINENGNTVQVRNIGNKLIERTIDDNILISDEEIYYLNGVATKEDKKYMNTNIFYSSLNKAKQIKKLEDMKIGEEKYLVYTYITDKKTMKEILDITNIKNEKYNNSETKVFITKDNYLYKVIYSLDNEETLQIIYKKLNETTEPAIKKEDDH